MEVPFYYSFKEFEKNYNTDLQNWLNTFYDVSEGDFLNELKDLYIPFVSGSGKYNFCDGIEIVGVSKNKVFNGLYDMQTYKYLVIEEIKKKIDLHNSFDENFKINYETENFLEYWYLINEPNFSDVLFDTGKHKFLKFFFNIGYPYLKFDEKKYKNFSFSVVKIAEWIDEKINTLFPKKKNIEPEPLTKKQVQKTNLSNSEKIKLKGSLQSIGFIFSELIDKGYIEAPKRNGNNNTSAISRMILEHFEFIDKEEQPKPEDIRKTLFIENKLSADKQTLFKIPESKIINTD